MKSKLLPILLDGVPRQNRAQPFGNLEGRAAADEAQQDFALYYFGPARGLEPDVPLDQLTLAPLSSPALACRFRPA